MAYFTKILIFCSFTLLLVLTDQLWGTYPVVRPERIQPASNSGEYTLRPHVEKQTVWGLGFEIQCDSIASENKSLPDSTSSVPADLIPSERLRLAREMLKGFRYCRLAGGLYWRHTDPEGKYFLPRWPNQLNELKDLLDKAGVEGLSFEYWSPPPFWKDNKGLTRMAGGKNTLRCFGIDFAEDPIYQGNVSQFLTDYAQSCIQDLKTLADSGLKVCFWGLANEPWVTTSYSSCYYTQDNYIETFKAVAPSIRNYDPQIKIIADTMWDWPRYIAPIMTDPNYAHYVDALVVHAIGEDSSRVVKNRDLTRKNITTPRPLFQNEYEYLQGPSSPARCLNTVQNIMNWFQLAESPSWFWIHALKPAINAEASGYALGYWMPIDQNHLRSHQISDQTDHYLYPRTSNRYYISSIPEQLIGTYYVTIDRQDYRQPAPEYQFRINKKSRIYLAIHDRGTPTLPADWNPTDLSITWDNKFSDRLYIKDFSPGIVTIPGHNGQDNFGFYGLPNMAFIEDISYQAGPVEISSLPDTLGAITGTVLNQSHSHLNIQPGHWTWNPYNWHALAGFLRHMPWDSTVIDIQEQHFDNDLRILAFKRPDNRMVIVLSNRCFKEYTFNLSGISSDSIFKGYRYTPENAGPDFLGVPIRRLSGSSLAITVPDMSWEFWIEQ